MTQGLSKRVLYTAAICGLALVFSTPAQAGNPVFGTIQVNGPVFLADSAKGWDPVELTRPMVAGDQLRTGEEGYLLADLGSQGIVGMYSNTEIAAGGAEDGPLIDVVKGKLAFHMAAHSGMTITAADAQILPAKNAGETPADGYVEINENGDAVVAVEEGELAVRVAGADRTLKKGERLLLNQAALGGQFDENDRLAALDSPPAAATDEETDEAAGILLEGDDNTEEGALAASLAAGVSAIPVEAAVGAGLALVTGAVLITHDDDDSNGSPN